MKRRTNTIGTPTWASIVFDSTETTTIKIEKNLEERKTFTVGPQGFILYYEQTNHFRGSILLSLTCRGFLFTKGASG